MAESGAPEDATLGSQTQLPKMQINGETAQDTEDIEMTNGLTEQVQITPASPAGSTPNSHAQSQQPTAASESNFAPGTLEPAPTPVSATPAPSTAASVSTTSNTNTNTTATQQQQQQQGIGQGAAMSPARGSPAPVTAPAVVPNGIIPPLNAHGSPTRVYLNSKVTPHVLEGLKFLAKHEPEKPLKWLAEFLAKKSAEVEDS